MSKVSGKRRTVFFCSDCGYEGSRWMGFCPSPQCDSRSPLVEGSVAPAPYLGGTRSTGWLTHSTSGVRCLDDVSIDDQPRIPLPSGELNRVLGGGIVPGSVSLLTGEPGVGKSTLLIQLAHWLASSTMPRKTLERGPVMYVSGEESPAQVKLRAERMGIPGQGILLLAETDVDTVLEHLETARPGLVIVDSIQTLHCESESGAPGSVGQVRHAGLLLLRWAKQNHTPVFVSGHLTKDGSLAGPRVLEHMVDVVLHLDSQESGAFRTLRAAKNRFGSTDETGIFQMTGSRPGRRTRPFPGGSVPDRGPATGGRYNAGAGGHPFTAGGGAGIDQLLAASHAPASGQRRGP